MAADFFITISLTASSASAEYSVYQGEYGFLSGRMQVQMAALGEINERSGDPGADKLSNIYWEHTFEPEIRGG